MNSANPEDIANEFKVYDEEVNTIKFKFGYIESSNSEIKVDLKPKKEENENNDF
jgi:hypothetical protein